MKINLKSIIAITVGTIGLISSLMTIDNWLEDRYSMKEPTIKYEYNYYIID